MRKLNIKVTLTEDEATALAYFLKEHNNGGLDSKTLEEVRGKVVSAITDARFKEREKVRNTPVKERKA